jgi:RNA polymerase sigma-70 factor (ECF subfamily)
MFTSPFGSAKVTQPKQTSPKKEHSPAVLSPSDSSPEELQLLRRARALEEDALALVHDRYYNAIFRYIAFRVDDYATSEDLTSEVFMRLLTALRDHTAPQNTLRGWLFGTATRVVQDFFRKKYNRPVVDIDEQWADDNETPAQMVDKKLDQEKLYHALQQLTEEQQQVLAFRFGQGLTAEEVAKLLGKSSAAVKMLQARALASLARLMAEGGVTP